MNVPRRLVVLVLILVVTLPQASAWTQLGGGPARDGVAAVAPGPLDVHALFRLHGDDAESHKFHGSAFAVTPHGLVGVYRDAASGACTLLRYSVDDDARVEVPLDDCRRGWSHGYDVGNERLLLCNVGEADEASLQARDVTTGAVAWSVTPADLGAVAADGVNWLCDDAAIDTARGEVAVTWVASRSGADFPTHRIARLRLSDGAVDWWTTVPTTALLGFGGVPQTGAAGPNFLPLSVTATTTGYLVPGLFFCTGEPVCEPPTDPDAFPYSFALAWLDRSGGVNGFMVAQDPATMGARSGAATGGSLWAASSSSLGVHAIGERLVRIDPLRGVIKSGSLQEAQGFAPGYAGWDGPVWAGDTVYAPLERSLVAFRASDLSVRWSWPSDHETWRVATTAASPAGEVLMLHSHFVPWERPEDDREPVAAGQTAVDEQRLVRFDREGAVLQRIPLPLGHRFVTMPEIALPGAGPLAAWYHESSILPLDAERLVVVSQSGEAALLGPARTSAAPSVAVSTHYPRPGETVTFTIEDPTGLRALYAQWDGADGDRLVPDRPDAPFRVSHTYHGTGREQATLTFVAADGTTATRTFVLEVGGAPPRSLNFMQQAFSERWEDTTWGVIGLLIAAMGGVFGFLYHRRHRTRFQKELAVLDNIRAMSIERPFETLEELEAFRGRIHAALYGGRLTDGEYGLLMMRMAAVVDRVRGLLVAPFAAKLSATFQKDLDAAFADGLVDAKEERLLRERLAKERRISSEERATLTRVLDVWSR